jgi:hypothetical protein
MSNLSNFGSQVCTKYIFAVTSKPKKKDNDTMTMIFLLHKDKEEKGNTSPQKQECGCPSLQPSLRSHTHAFFSDPPIDNKLLINN